jgi:AcrR family transcriptional regulator
MPHLAEEPRAELRSGLEAIERLLVAKIVAVRPGLRPFSRREALLEQAIDLFAEHTYTSVSIEDVAASLGIAGPSVYNHFQSKSEILATALGRGSTYLSIQVVDALAAADSPGSALRAIIASYTRFAIAHSVVHLLRQIDPELPGPDARVRIQAVLMVANDIARTPRLRDRTATADLVSAVCEQLVDVPR